MSKYDRVSLIFSALALLVPIVSPIITYYVFDANEKDYNYRARFVGTGNGTETSWEKNPKHLHISWSVINIGKRPANNIQVAILYKDAMNHENEVNFNPLTNYEIEKRKGYIFYKLATLVPPGGLLEVSVNSLVIKAYP